MFRKTPAKPDEKRSDRLPAAFKRPVASAEAPIHKAILNGEPDHFKRALAALPGEAEAFDDSGSAPIHHAAKRDNFFTRALVAAGADVRIPCDSGAEAIHLAARAGNAANIRTLVGAGADPNAPWHDDADERNTPLHLAARNGHAEALLVLLELGADQSRTNGLGLTPRQSALAGSYLETIRIFDEIQQADLRSREQERERVAAEAASSAETRRELRSMLGFVPSEGQLRRLAAAASHEDEPAFNESVRSILGELPTLSSRRAERAQQTASPAETLAAARVVDDWIAIGNAPPRPVALSAAVRLASAALAAASEATAKPGAAVPRQP